VAGRRLAFWLLTAAIGVFVAAPLALLVLNSFRDVKLGDLGFRLTNLTLQNYLQAYGSSGTYSVLLNSIIFALGAMLVALLLGGSLAFLVERTDIGHRGLISALAVVPLAMPGVVNGMAWVLLLSPGNGLLNQVWQALFGHILGSAYSLPAMAWVEGTAMSMLAFLLLGASFRQMDPALEEASRVNGASPLQTLLRVNLPLLKPALAGVTLLLAVRGMEAFEIPMVLGFHDRIFVFATSIYYALHDSYPPEYGLGFAYSMSLVVLALIALSLYQRQLRLSREFVTVSGKGYRPQLLSLGRWRPVAWVAVASYALVIVALPLFILAWASLQGFYRPLSLDVLPALSLKNYLQIASDAAFRSALWNTVLLGCVTTTAILCLSLLASWFIYRSGLAGRRVLDYVIFLPYAFPGIAIGVAFMILFLSFRNPIYNTIWIIILAYVVTFLPIGSRFTHAAMVQIQAELEEAAWLSGAGFWRTMRWVWVPLLKPALIAGGLFLLILSFKALAIAALLQSPDSLVVPVYLWNLWDRGGATGPSCALALMLVALISLFPLLARHRSGATGELAVLAR
jgi:iron(III) transport system permease protein